MLQPVARIRGSHVNRITPHGFASAALKPVGTGGAPQAPAETRVANRTDSMPIRRWDVRMAASSGWDVRAGLVGEWPAGWARGRAGRREEPVAGGRRA